MASVLSFVGIVVLVGRVRVSREGGFVVSISKEGGLVLMVIRGWLVSSRII